jgi:hypothetical protein
VGTLFGSILTWTPLRIGDVVFDANTLLICSMSQLIGFQLTIFGLFAKALAVRQELIPEQKYLKKFLVMANLERGLIAGLTVFLSGLALLFIAVSKRHGLDPPAYSDSLRITIPGATLLMLGLQTMFSSFFLSIPGLKKR